MGNPFLAVQAGVFATVPSGDEEPSLAERICAALAARIAKVSPDQKRLDPVWWSEVFNNVPFLSAAAEVNGSLGADEAGRMAQVALGGGISAVEPAAVPALAAWIGALPLPPTLLNSMAVTCDASDLIHLSLAFIDAGLGSFRRTDATINAGTAANRGRLLSIFEAAPPLEAQPYFCRLAAAA